MAASAADVSSFCDHAGYLCLQLLKSATENHLIYYSTAGEVVGGLRILDTANDIMYLSFMSIDMDENGKKRKACVYVSELLSTIRSEHRKAHPEDYNDSI